MLLALTTIRCAEARDFSPAVTLLRSAGLPTADLARVDLWVAEVEASPVGVVGVERFGTCALLRSLAVAPEHRARGLGRQLVAHVEDAARAQGLQRLVLLTETAEPFFRALGYAVTSRGHVPEDVQRSAEFASLCPASAVCMSKSLG
jgi:amino-acid N-acetyltransferase